MSLSRCSGPCSSTDFGGAVSASLYLAGFEDACRLPPHLCREQLFVCGSWSSSTSFDNRQAQWVAGIFSVEGVVRDSLRVSDADDLSQLTTV